MYSSPFTRLAHDHFPAPDSALPPPLRIWCSSRRHLPPGSAPTGRWSRTGRLGGRRRAALCGRGRHSRRPADGRLVQRPLPPPQPVFVVGRLESRGSLRRPPDPHPRGATEPGGPAGQPPPSRLSWFGVGGAAASPSPPSAAAAGPGPTGATDGANSPASPPRPRPDPPPSAVVGACGSDVSPSTSPSRFARGSSAAAATTRPDPAGGGEGSSAAISPSL